jgi:outer membrane protein OmpA-like peptidoglycan-associated protein
MSIGKKIFFLLIALVLLIAYTVSTFNYKTILSDGTNQATSFSSEDSMFGEYADMAISKINDLKSTVLEEIGLDEGNNLGQDKEPIDLELVKDNGIILMNGTFKDAEQAKSIVDLLNINRNGEYEFEENRVKDVVLLNKLSLLMDSFKEFFTDGSVLSIENSKVLLNGELKDANFKPLLDSIIAKSNLDITTNIKEPIKSKTEKIIDNIKKASVRIEKEVSSESENKLNELENITPKNEDIEVKSKLVQDAQDRINNLTADKKITFKRRSTNITEESKETVKEIASILLDNSKLKVKIEGHTDSRGRASLNKKISQDRANSVKTALMSLGVNAKRIKAIGYGEDFPIAKDDAEGLSEVNRRVEFIVGETK